MFRKEAYILDLTNGNKYPVPDQKITGAPCQENVLHVVLPKKMINELPWAVYVPSVY